MGADFLLDIYRDLKKRLKHERLRDAYSGAFLDKNVGRKNIGAFNNKLLPSRLFLSITSSSISLLVLFASGLLSPLLLLLTTIVLALATTINAFFIATGLLSKHKEIEPIKRNRARDVNMQIKKFIALNPSLKERIVKFPYRKPLTGLRIFTDINGISGSLAGLLVLISALIAVLFASIVGSVGIGVATGIVALTIMSAASRLVNATASIPIFNLRRKLSDRWLDLINNEFERLMKLRNPENFKQIKSFINSLELDNKGFAGYKNSIFSTLYSFSTQNKLDTEFFNKIDKSELIKVVKKIDGLDDKELDIHRKNILLSAKMQDLLCRYKVGGDNMNKIDTIFNKIFASHTENKYDVEIFKSFIKSSTIKYLEKKQFDNMSEYENLLTEKISNYYKNGSFDIKAMLNIDLFKENKNKVEFLPEYHFSLVADDIKSSLFDGKYESKKQIIKNTLRKFDIKSEQENSKKLYLFLLDGIKKIEYNDLVEKSSLLTEAIENNVVIEKKIFGQTKKYVDFDSAVTEIINSKIFKGKKKQKDKEMLLTNEIKNNDNHKKTEINKILENGKKSALDYTKSSPSNEITLH